MCNLTKHRKIRGHKLLVDPTLSMRNTKLGRLWFLPLFLRKYNIEAVIHPFQWSLAEFVISFMKSQDNDVNGLERKTIAKPLHIPNLFPEFEYDFLWLNYQEMLEENWNPPKSVLWILTQDIETNAKISLVDTILAFKETFDNLIIVSDTDLLSKRNDFTKRFLKDELDAQTGNISKFLAQLDFTKEPYQELELDLIDYFDRWGEWKISKKYSYDAKLDHFMDQPFLSDEDIFLRSSEEKRQYLENRELAAKIIKARRLKHIQENVTLLNEKVFEQIAQPQAMGPREFREQVAMRMITPFLRRKKIAYAFVDIILNEIIN